MRDRNPIVDRWLALPTGPFHTRLIAGRTRRDGSVAVRYLDVGQIMRYAYLAEQEHVDDGRDDLGGVCGLFWNLVAS